MGRVNKRKAYNGIHGWFSTQRIYDMQHRESIMDMFLQDFKFNAENIRECRLANAKLAFIQKNWSKFTQYVQKNYKFYLELQYS